jgi:hypothetical protein
MRETWCLESGQSRLLDTAANDPALLNTSQSKCCQDMDNREYSKFRSEFGLQGAGFALLSSAQAGKLI